MEEDDDTTRSKQFIPFKSLNVTPCHFISQRHLIFDKFEIIQKFLTDYKFANPARKSWSTELRLLKNLQNEYPNVVFKPSDKNLGLVAMDIAHYNTLVMNHLSNDSNYSLVAYDYFATTALKNDCHQKFKSICQNADIWYPHEQKFLAKHSDFKLPEFYILPKVHKTGPLSGRPIAGAVKWITTPVSKILELRLKPLLLPYDTVLKNSQQLVDEFALLNSGPPPCLENFYFITGDVVSLYPNINIIRLKTILDRLDFTLSPIAAFVLDNSFVKYATKIYKQLSGIAMGTNAAVSLANIYMAEIYDRFISSQPQVRYYRRYIDDLFIIWTGTIEQWNNLVRLINHLDISTNIEFASPSTTSAVFLDLNLTMNPLTQKIHTSVFQKELNKYLYITPDSCHVPHMFSGFLKGELTRYARLSSDNYSYIHIKKLFYQRLVDRGYARRFLNRIFNQHHWTDRLKERVTSSAKLLPFIVPYSRRANFKTIELLFKKLQYDFEDYVHYSKAMLVYSKASNTKDLVTSSALTNDQSRKVERLNST